MKTIILLTCTLLALLQQNVNAKIIDSSLSEFNSGLRDSQNHTCWQTEASEKQISFLPENISKNYHKEVLLSDNNHIKAVRVYKVDGIDELNTFDYDERGNLISRLWQRLIDGQWIDSLRYINKYNSSDSLIESLYENQIGNKWYPIQKLLKYYDENNNLILNILQKFDKGA